MEIAKLPSAWGWYHKLSRWQKIKLWFMADIPLFFDRWCYKITGKWLLK